MSVPVPVLPDAESALLYALVPLEPDIRFVTVMPGGELTGIVARVHRISGAARDLHVDRPIIDIDVYGLKSETGNVSAAARRIAAHILGMMSRTVTNGVIQHSSVIAGPRQLPEANPDIVRYSATFEVLIHP